MFRTSNKSILGLVLVLGLNGSFAFAADNKDRPQKPRTVHVFTVGVARSRGDNQQAVLLGADRNAERVATFFKTQEGRLADEVRTTTLVNEEATAANILNGLDCLEDAMEPGDLAIVHISAHGGPFGASDWFFAAYDWTWDGRIAGTVTGKQLRQRLEKLPGKVILILDSCHSGAIGTGTANRLETGEAGLVVFVAAQSDQYGYYRSWVAQRTATLPVGVQTSGTVVTDAYGLFTTALLEALSGRADANGDGVVTLSEVAAYVSARVAGQTNWSEAQKKAMAARGVPAVQQTPDLRKPETVSDDTPLAIVR
jgi:hypothetical protein